MLWISSSEVWRPEKKKKIRTTALVLVVGLGVLAQEVGHMLIDEVL